MCGPSQQGQTVAGTNVQQYGGMNANGQQQPQGGIQYAQPSQGAIQQNGPVYNPTDPNNGPVGTGEYTGGYNTLPYTQEPMNHEGFGESGPAPQLGPLTYGPDGTISHNPVGDSTPVPNAPPPIQATLQPAPAQESTLANALRAGVGGWGQRQGPRESTIRQQQQQAQQLQSPQRRRFNRNSRPQQQPTYQRPAPGPNMMDEAGYYKGGSSGNRYQAPPRTAQTGGRLTPEQREAYKNAQNPAFTGAAGGFLDSLNASANKVRNSGTGR